jgi:hypothetical protein
VAENGSANNICSRAHRRFDPMPWVDLLRQRLSLWAANAIPRKRNRIIAREPISFDSAFWPDSGARFQAVSRMGEYRERQRHPPSLRNPFPF